MSARPDTPDPEDELLARARTGDEDAFAGLVTLHADLSPDVKKLGNHTFEEVSVNPGST